MRLDLGHRDHHRPAAESAPSAARPARAPAARSAGARLSAGYALSSFLNWAQLLVLATSALVSQARRAVATA